VHAGLELPPGTDDLRKSRGRPSTTGPRLPQIVPSGSGTLFAGTRRAEQRASTTAVDGRLLLRRQKEERRGYRPGSLLQIVLNASIARRRELSCLPAPAYIGTAVRAERVADRAAAARPRARDLTLLGVQTLIEIA
jgi:hypothetical protein